MISKVLEEMVKNAAEEIGFEYDEGMTDLVKQYLELKHGIDLNEVNQITWQVMNIITEEVREWQTQTEMNFTPEDL